ncbi:MAG: hypothetical protein AAGF71_04375 [Pseudomonadota bacterium]
MTAKAQTGLALGLAVLAIALLGFTTYQARTEIATLEATIELQNDELATLYGWQNEFSSELVTEEFQSNMALLVEIEDMEARWAIADETFATLDALWVPYGQGVSLYKSLSYMADALDRADRDAARDLVVEEFGLDNEADIQLPPPIASLDTAKTISTLVTAGGALGSALMSLVVFFQSGDKRKHEGEMYALELEMKRIEVAKARHAAKDILAHEPATT